ncbi:MAG: hypothetical protein JW776_05495 [Candidatus Lokiarchaeota archaeon]|nr:hypothetical protein [Candidatus Lokiarchaeota archaeon]
MQNTHNMISLEGTYYDAGFQQGRVNKENLWKMYNLLPQFGDFICQKPKDIPLTEFIESVKTKTTKKLKSLYQKFAPDCWEYNLGIVNGASLPMDNLLLLQNIEISIPQVDYIIHENEEFPILRTTGLEGACTTSLTTPEWSETGGILMTKNFGYPFITLFIHYGKRLRLKGRNQVLSFSLSPLVGAPHGMNEAGLTISYNYAYPQDGPIEGLPISTLVQEALLNFTTVKETVDYFKKMPRGNGAMVTIGDADGNSICLELCFKTVGIRTAEKGRLIVTNDLLSPEGQSVDKPPNARFSDSAHPGLRGKLMNESSKFRYDRMDYLFYRIMSKGKITIKDLHQIMTDHGPTGYGSDNTICRHGPAANTTTAIIFDIKNLCLYGTIGSPCKHNLKQYTFLK